MIYTIGGIKGGSGKTTIAVSLAVVLSQMGRSVLLVDADIQATATEFSRWRTESLGDTGFTSIQLAEMQVRNEVRKLKANYDDIIIDAGGRDTASQRAALIVSDAVIVPFAPRSFDIWTLEQVERLIKEIQIANPNLEAYAVLNKVDQNQRDRKDALQYIKEGGTFECLKAQLHERKVFANAAASGLAVTEAKPKNPKAIEELTALVEEVVVLESKKRAVA
ncbi:MULTISPECIES: AAA family ATPase [Phaeodactylibacter]|jgi:chromosome partitioning protein|uniref:AAA family ATPase n=1 Tax=Phaeodactylibacter luteus TaxID=1564516 RepID=A0A5C6RH10_9BACT|nr:AAA family ATPase [Phaeodactylibacter luteus]TXB61344.1 AAA family ATPase [Phaeodactylibacter luteus]